MAVKLTGFKEFDRALAELPKATQRNTLRRALTKAAEPVLRAMEAKAPVADAPYYRGKGDNRKLVQPGFTQKSLAISNSLNPSNRRDQKKEGKAFAEVYVGSRRGSAAALQEFGTISQPAHPYLRPAWEETKEGALRIFSAELGKEIEKSAARLAKKQAKGG